MEEELNIMKLQRSYRERECENVRRNDDSTFGKYFKKIINMEDKTSIRKCKTRDILMLALDGSVEKQGNGYYFDEVSYDYVNVDGEKMLLLQNVGNLKEYYNDKELTDKFIIEYNGEKLYKTNDLFLKKDNELFYVGRSDDMLKRNGKRVYLSEIENIVGAIKGVKDHICVKEDLDDKTFQIIAYVVVDNADSFNEGKKAVDDSFASYMLPNKYIIVDEIPKTINGKRQNILKGELK